MSDLRAAAEVVHDCEGPGCRADALHKAWVGHGGDYYYGPDFWALLVSRFAEVVWFVERRPALAALDEEKP